MSKIMDLDNMAKDNTPTLVLIDISDDEEQRLKRISREGKSSTSPSLSRRLTNETDSGDIYGSRLLSHIASEIQINKLSKLIIPIAVVSGYRRGDSTIKSSPSRILGSQAFDESGRIFRFMDAGALDVLTSPVTKERAQGLLAQAYRVYKEVSKSDSSFLASKRTRKMSWVGVDEEKPFAYLRVSMVSNLMSGICSPETDFRSDLSEMIDNGYVITRRLLFVFLSLIKNSGNRNGRPFVEWVNDLEPDRKEFVKKAIGSWSFSAHEFSNDELVYAALLMLSHALQLPELKPWKLTSGLFFITLFGVIL
jgi:hypothetical protein